MSKPIRERIIDAFKDGELALSYHDLLHRVFPPSEYPNAYRYSCNGGPPGCAMPFRKALNKLGMKEFYKDGDFGGTGYFLPPRIIRDA